MVVVGFAMSGANLIQNHLAMSKFCYDELGTNVSLSEGVKVKEKA
jgi:hypothetical protein